MDLRIGDKIAYIRRFTVDGNQGFDLLKAEVDKIVETKKGKKIYTSPKIFSRPMDVEEVDDCEICRENKYIVVQTPVKCDEKYIEHLEKLVSEWNKNGSKSIFD